MGIWSGRDKTLDLLKYAEPIARQRQPQLRFQLAEKEAKSVMERMTCKTPFFYQHGENTDTFAGLSCPIASPASKTAPESSPWGGRGLVVVVIIIVSISRLRRMRKWCNPRFSKTPRIYTRDYHSKSSIRRWRDFSRT